MNPVSKAFGATVAELRKQKGVSQEKLAELGELDRTFVSLLERGLRQPSLTTILGIGKALNVPPDKLVKLTAARLKAK